MSKRTHYYFVVSGETYEIFKITKQGKVASDFAEKMKYLRNEAMHVYMFNSNFYPEVLDLNCGDILPFVNR